MSLAKMFRLFGIVSFMAFGLTSANAEQIYRDASGRTLRMYYSWDVAPTGATKLQVQLVNYSSVTWVDIVLKCEVMSFTGVRSAPKEIRLAAPVFDYELSKDVNNIDIGTTEPKATLNCAIDRAGHGEATLRPASR